MRVMMLAYSALLTVGLMLSAPWWLLRMATTQRYREGLGQRLGRVAAGLRAAVEGKKIVWIHAVSVGEVLAASRLVGELEAALGEGWGVVVSTTTRTGQALARERFGVERVFYYPLDFAFAVRAYMRVLKPAAVVLMESEVWPRMLHEARKMGVPVVVVNARVSDRSFGRGKRVRGLHLWGSVLGKVTLWLAQSEEDARRLVAMGARAEAVRVGGNLKYDVRATETSRVAEWIEKIAGVGPVIVAGSTVGGGSVAEEALVLDAWLNTLGTKLDPLLVLAPRHTERFAQVEAIVAAYPFPCPYIRASDSLPVPQGNGALSIVLLDTIGDLGAVYGVADVAFVGGSMVKRGGHNPLEPAQFGVPVVMGPSFENFRDIVAKMQAVDGIRLVKDKDELGTVLSWLLTNRDAAKAIGERGRRVFEEQQGATGRAVEAIVAMIQGVKS